MSSLLKMVLAVAMTCAVAGCGSDSETGTCPSVAGSWKITSHCESSQVNQIVTVGQSGCSITYAAPFTGWTGTVSADGVATAVGSAGGSTQMTCSGKVQDTSWSLSCTPTCQVMLQKQ